MLSNGPKDDYKYIWTMHSKNKLRQYGIGPNLVKRVLRHPDRTEEGIAQNTVAKMKDRSTKKTKKEVWVMYQRSGIKKKIISTWIYPGETPKGKEIFVPDDVWEELKKLKEKKEA